MITNGRDCGSALWINIKVDKLSSDHLPKQPNHDLVKIHNTGVINDPLGPTHNPAIAITIVLFCAILKLWGQTDGHPCVIIVITTGRELTEWYNKA